MFCTYCGKENKNNESFCEYCGEKKSSKDYELRIRFKKIEFHDILNYINLIKSYLNVKSLFIAILIFMGGILFCSSFHYKQQDPYKVINTFVDAFYYSNVEKFNKNWNPTMINAYRNISNEEKKQAKQNLREMANKIEMHCGKQWIKNIYIESNYNSNQYFVKDVDSQQVIFEIILVEIDGDIYINGFTSNLFY